MAGTGLIAGNWKKLAAPLVLGSVLFGALVFAVASRVLLGNLQQLENEAARQASLQVGSSFAFDTEHLHRLSSTYAEWDDAFTYARGAPTDFVDRNFTPAYLDSIDVDHVWVLDVEGHLIASASRLATPSDTAIPVDPLLTARILRAIGNPVALRKVPPERRFLNLSGELYSVAAHKITRDDLSGDAGTLVFARLWVKERIDRIAELTRRKLAVAQPATGESPEETVHLDGSGAMHVHAWLMQPDGRPAVMVSVDWKRDLLFAARRTTLAVICALIAGFLALMALLAVRLRRSENAVLAHQKHLARQARTDALTGLRNRSVLDELLQPRPGATAAAVLYIDVDRFKTLNDSLGHAAGDDILRVVAQRLQAAVSSRDHVVRLGGDEFLLIVLDVASREALAQIARRVRDRFADHVQAADSMVQVTLSIGAALYPADASTIAETIRCADLALYQAKERGRNGYQIYDADLGRRKAEADLMRDALERAVRDNQITLEYQPQYGTANGVLSGFEALARWDDAQLGSVPPTRFIPLAEQCGLIDALGQQVILKVCRQIAEWRSRDVPVRPISINLSARQFESGTLVDVIRTATREFGVEPQLLVFEITESVFMNQTDSHANALQQLRALGFHIAIDDFGTGYSSLSYLRLLPVSTIKIDRSFIHDLDGPEADDALVRSILDIARHFRLNVIAEGVETHTQLARLRELQCDAVQGYFLNRPMSARDSEQILLMDSLKREPSTTQPLRIVR